MKTKRSKACNITYKVKRAVWERDGGRCILCGSPNAMPNAHYISRARGGLGIEENILTLCTSAGNNCHYRFDNGTADERKRLKEQARAYLSSRYPNWNEEMLTFKKWG